MILIVWAQYNITGVLPKGEIWTDRHTKGEPHVEHEHEDRDCGDNIYKPENAKDASNPPESRRETWNRFFPTALRRN